MTSYIGAVGVGLPQPLPLYPVTVGNIPGVASTNRIALPPGGDFLIPSGKFMVSPGQYSQVQILDPVTNTWLPFSVQTMFEPIMIDSDGTNYRVVNPTGQPIGAVVTNSGSGFTSTPTVTAAPGGSTWIAVVGGAVSNLICNTAGSGTGYAVPPLINIAAPPSPGVQATAICTISGGSIATFTITNPGAGYTSIPAVVLTPQQSDLNFNAAGSTTVVKNGSVTAQLSFAQQVTAVLLTNEGNINASVAPALTFAGGGGTGAAATAILAQSIQSITVSTGGSGYPSSVGIQTFGGSLFTQTSGLGAQTNNPIVSSLLMPAPRQAQIAATQGSGSGVQISTIMDAGLFTAPPTAYAVPSISGTSGTGVLASFSVTMGGVNDVVTVQPL